MNKGVLAITIIALLVLGFTGGYYLGNQTGIQAGSKETEARLRPIIETVFSPPPENIMTLTGSIKGIYGGTLRLEIFDPEDYLPHTDGTARNTEPRNAVTTADTQYVSINYARLDAKGNPRITPLALSDLKVGMKITVHADHNIRTLEQFDVTKVEVVNL